jgi:hypothetical protein
MTHLAQKGDPLRLRIIHLRDFVVISPFENAVNLVQPIGNA